jgi:L-iditol 2-dehydrogenase
MQSGKEFMSGAGTISAVVQFELREDAIELRELPAPPELAEDEVLLSTRAVGVCGSEIHQYHNTQSWPVRVPVVLGHEFCGVVKRVGRSVEGFHEGERVASETAARICGRCAFCRSGDYNLCPERLGFGYGVDGGMADLVNVPARCLHHLPDAVSFEKAALAEPCSVAYNAACVKTLIRPGDAVLILGPGPVGLLCLLMAKLSGAGWLGAAGLAQDEKRLAMARQLGADSRILLGSNRAEARTQIREALRQQGDGLGVEAVIDSTGASASLDLALEAVRPGGQITKVGWGPQPLDFSLDRLVQKAVRLQGSFSHNYPVWERVIALLASGRLDPSPLVGRVAALADWRACFEEMAAGKIVKGILTPNRRGS